MSDLCVICGKPLPVDSKRFGHLIKHLQDGTGYARLDVKKNYWLFFKKINSPITDGSQQKET